MTIVPPIIVRNLGLSFVNVQTHNGPNIVSKSIIILTFEAGVILEAFDKSINDSGRMNKPVIDI